MVNRNDNFLRVVITMKHYAGLLTYDDDIENF
jgi:hypothetical protein